MHLRSHDSGRLSHKLGWCEAASTASVASPPNAEVSRQLYEGPVPSVSVKGHSAWSRDLTFLNHLSRLCSRYRSPREDKNRGLLRWSICQVLLLFRVSMGVGFGRCVVYSLILGMTV